MPTAAASASPAPAAAAPPARRGSFLIKVLLAAALVAAADRLFYGFGIGSTLGLFALLLLGASLAARPAVRRNKAALAASGAALLLALILVDDPSLLAWVLFWTAAATAALMPRAQLDNALRWVARLLRQGFATLVLPVRDLIALRRARRRSGPHSLAARAPLLFLPLIGSLVFLLLFARANPLIGDALAALRPDFRAGSADPFRILFWLLVFALAWSLLRPSAHALAPARLRAAPTALPGVSLASVTLSLVAFNAIFAVQNALDIVFLWSGAPLPQGMTLAEYAHRGAYPLIATALLAGLFVLVTLQPGTAMAQSRRLRRLVYVWIGQNVLLVASTMLRTLDYVGAYSLTRLRIAALVWMALVGIGLVLICWRIWRGRSGAWLINANCAAALAVLTGCAAVDLGAVAASWNVRHARDAGGPGAALDLCYLNSLGESALLPLVELESGRIGPVLRDRVAWSRTRQMKSLEAKQASWRSWTLRGARRLASARERVAERRLPRVGGEWRSCDGMVLQSPPPPPRPRFEPASPPAPPVGAVPQTMTAEPAAPPPPAPAPALTPPAAR